MDYLLVCVILTTLYTNQGDTYGKQLNTFTKCLCMNIHVLVCPVKFNAVHVNVNHDFFKNFFLVLTIDTYLTVLCNLLHMSNVWN